MDDKTKKNQLSEIFESDSLGLLAVDELKAPTVSSQDSRLIDSFQEISDFYETNQRCPELGDDIGEYRLASRLAAIKKDPKKVFLSTSVLAVVAQEIANIADRGTQFFRFRHFTHGFIFLSLHFNNLLIKV